MAAEDEVLLKFRFDTESLDADYKDILAKTDNLAKSIESKPLKIGGVEELKAALKLIASESKEINFTKASQDIDSLVNDSAKLKTLISELSKSLQGMKQGTTEFKALDSIIQSANKQLATLGKTAETTGKSIKSQYREAVAEVQSLADKFGLLDKRTVQAAKAAAELRDTVGDAQRLVQAFNPDTKFQGITNAISGAAGAFTAFQGAMTLVGGESENVQKALLKVNGAIALSTGIAQLEQSKDSFKALAAQAISTFQAIRAQIGLTGIGAIALAIGAILYNWDKIKEAVTGVNSKMIEQKDIAREQISTLEDRRKIIDYEATILESNGASERQILAYKNEQIAITIEQQKKNLETIKNTEIAQLESWNTLRRNAIKYFGTIATMVLGEKDNKEAIQKTEEKYKQDILKLDAELAEGKIKQTALDKKSADDLAAKNKKAADEAEARAKKIAGENKDFFDNEFKYRSRNIELADDYWKNEEKKLEIIGNKQSAQNDFNRKKAEEAAQLEVDLDTWVSKKEEELLAQGQDAWILAQKEKEDKLKGQIQTISDFARNGILLQIGIDPASVDRIKASVLNAVDVFKNGAGEDKLKAAADVLGNTYFAVSEAIRNNERQEAARKIEELNQQQEEEIRLAGDNEQKKNDIKQKYELKRKEIKRKEAEADKRKAIFDAVIATAVGIAQNIGTPFLIPIIAALGAAQIALIQAQPIPKFEKGGRVKDGLIHGKPHSAGGVLLEAEGNEFIVNKNSTSKHLDLIDAINQDKAEEYLNKNVILPALQKKESEIKAMAQASQLDYENHIINRAMNKTLNEIKRGNDKNTDRIVQTLAKSNYTL